MLNMASHFNQSNIVVYYVTIIEQSFYEPDGSIKTSHVVVS